MKKMKIKEFATVISGSTPKTNVDDYWDGENLWITPAEIDGSRKFIEDTERKITDEGVKSASLNLLPVGTVLLTSRAPIGKVAVAAKEMYCNQGFKNLICNTKIVNPEYIYYWLSSKKNYLNSLGRGATFAEISKQIVENIEVPIRELDKQNKIVQVLDKAQSLIDKRKKQIEVCDELIKSKFIEMFGDPVVNSKNWSSELLVKNVTLLNGRAYKQNELLDKGKYPVLRVGNFFSNRDWYYSNLELDEDKFCHNGDLLFAWSASFGAKIWDGDKAIFHYHIWKLIVGGSYNKVFLCEMLNLTMESMMKQTHGIGMMHLTKSGVEQTEFIVPPIDLQNQFATFVQQVEKLKSSLQQSLLELETNFNALMQKAFNGELFE